MDEVVNSLNSCERRTEDEQSFRESLNKTIPGTAIKEKQFDLMWSFLMMGNQQSNIPALKELCESLRHMMLQKTAGQRKDHPKDVPFESLSTILCGIVIETMALYLSGDLDKIKEVE